MLRRKFYAVLAALAVAFGMTLAGAGTAQASHLGYHVWNDSSSTFHVRCWDHNGYIYIRTGVGPGETSAPDQCNAFSVGDNRNVRYQSLATGNYYWSGCGRTLPHSNPTPAGAYGWAYVGNDVAIKSVVAC